jgi:D-3-phosphoglycerate dehydrogenase
MVISKTQLTSPEVSMAKCKGQRIIFANKNVPKVLGSELSVLADHIVNVLDMMNKSRGNVIDAIRRIEHVTTIRLID